MSWRPLLVYIYTTGDAEASHRPLPNSQPADMKLVFLAIIVLIAVAVAASSTEPHKRVARCNWGVLKAAKAAKMDFLRKHLHLKKPLIFAHKIHSSPHHHYCKLHKRRGLKPGKVVYY